MTSTDDHSAKGCPLEAVHKRLEDLHRQWHQAEQAYFDPDAFRVAIQTAIQTSRTVTFILQSNKRNVPDFENWYGEWQKKFADIPLMRWMVDARNRIEKQGDLEALSHIRADIVASYLQEGPSIEVPAGLFDAPLKLLKSIPNSQLGEHIKKDGILRIQRKWIENTLPDFELLEAVAIAYGHLSEMLDAAHRQMGIAVPDAKDTRTGEVYDSASMKGRLPCMIGHSDLRTLDIWLANGRPVNMEVRERTIDLSNAGEGLERYDIKPEDIFGKSNDIERIQDSLFETASKMFLRDGYHISIMFLFRAGKLTEQALLEPEEHGEKYIMLRKLAQEVEKKGIDAAILLGETWTAPYDPEKPYRRAVDAPNKREALTATLVRKEGVPRQLSALVDRADGKLQLETPVEQIDGVYFMFAPFYEVWDRPVPEAWMKGFPDGAGPR